MARLKTWSICHFLNLWKPETLSDLNTHTYDEFVHHSVDAGPLEGRLTAVLHQLCILARKDDDPITPLRVTEPAASQENLFVGERVVLTLPRHLPFEPIQFVIG